MRYHEMKSDFPYLPLPQLNHRQRVQRFPYNTLYQPSHQTPQHPLLPSLHNTPNQTPRHNPKHSAHYNSRTHGTPLRGHPTSSSTLPLTHIAANQNGSQYTSHPTNGRRPQESFLRRRSGVIPVGNTEVSRSKYRSSTCFPKELTSGDTPVTNDRAPATEKQTRLTRVSSVRRTSSGRKAPMAKNANQKLFYDALPNCGFHGARIIESMDPSAFRESRKVDDMGIGELLNDSRYGGVGTKQAGNRLSSPPRRPSDGLGGETPSDSLDLMSFTKPTKSHRLPVYPGALPRNAANDEPSRQRQQPSINSRSNLARALNYPSDRFGSSNRSSSSSNRRAVANGSTAMPSNGNFAKKLPLLPWENAALDVSSIQNRLAMRQRIPRSRRLSRSHSPPPLISPSVRQSIRLATGNQAFTKQIYSKPLMPTMRAPTVATSSTAATTPAAHTLAESYDGLQGYLTVSNTSPNATQNGNAYQRHIAGRARPVHTPSPTPYAPQPHKKEYHRFSIAAIKKVTLMSILIMGIVMVILKLHFLMRNLLGQIVDNDI